MSLERPIARAKPESPEAAIPQEVLARTREQLVAISERPEAYLDEGGAAWVYRLPAGTCMKVMKPHTESGTVRKEPSNTPETEAIFLDYLSAVQVSGVRSPRYLALVREGDFVAVLMEEVEGINLQKVLNKEAPVPETFSHHVFFEALEKYVQDLHEREHVIHGDLDPRNVMVDAETGLPRVIDFGRSKWTRELDAATRARLERNEWAKLTTMEEKMAALGRG